MKKIIRYFIMLVLPAVFIMTTQAQTAKEIVTKAEDNIRGLTSIMEMTIQIVRPTWTRSMSVKAWAKGDKYSLMIVTAPAKDAGTIFLKRIKEIWNYVPSIEKIVKLPPSMMSQSFMGTDFTNDDLVKAYSRVDDYTHKIIGDSIIAGRKCWKIEMDPKSDAAVVWNKVYIWIDQIDYLELRLEYYDEDDALVNILQCSDIKSMGGRTIPCKMEMIPAQKKGQETVIIYNSAIFNQPLSDDFFTANNIKNIK